MIGKKKNKKSKTENIDLSNFSLADTEIATQLSDTEKQRILAAYELDKLIDQSGAESDYFVKHKKKLIFTHSPHLLNLQDVKLQKKEIETVADLSVAENDSKMSDSKESADAFLRLRKLAAWQTPKFSFKFPNLYKLSVIQFLYSIGEVIKLAWVSLKFSLRQTIGSASSLADNIGNNSKQGTRILSDTMFLRYSKSLLAFIVVAVLLVLPYFGAGLYSTAKTVKGRVLGISQEAAETWQVGLDSMMQGDWHAAADNFSQASLNFRNAEYYLQSYTSSLNKLPDWVNADATEIGSGLNLVEIGAVMSEISIKLNNIAALTTSEGMDLSDKLIVLAANLSEIEDMYSVIAPKIDKLNLDIIPSEYRPIFAAWKQRTNSLSLYLSELNGNLQWTLSLIGADEPKRYLLVFQNSNELRATGGFMGSFALLDMDQGEIKDLSIPGGGLYDLKAQVQKMVIAPYPHQLLGSRWQIWDANWWSDWPTSAKKIAWFYESAGGASVDGVIAVNSQLLVDLVGQFEPIVMPDYDKELTSSNVVTALQHAVEFEYDKDKNQPKQIIADLAPILIDKIYQLSPVELFDMAGMFSKHLDQENVQIFLFDEEMQKQIETKSWSGHIPNVTGDYLQVVVQNIGGGKSDEAMRQSIDYNLLIGPDNYLIAKTTIAREHQGNLDDVFTRQRNVAFIRVLTPPGSELISVEGAITPDERLFKEVPDYLEADKDLILYDGIGYYNDFDNYYSAKQFGKQVFGHWLMVDPGQEKKLTFIYRLPFKISKDETRNAFTQWLLPDQYKLNYSLYYDKQSGLDNQSFRFSFVVPQALDTKWFSDSQDSMYKIGKSLYSEAIVNEDYQLGFILR